METEKTSYWFDAWEGLPRAQEKNITIQHPLISLRDAWPCRENIDPMHTRVINLTFNEDRDAISWKWDMHGLYSARSIYKILIGGRKIRWPHHYIWSCKITPSAKIFIYLTLQEKILTRDQLRKRGMHIELACPVCNNCPVESIAHLFFLCPVAIEIWFHISILLYRPIMRIAGTVGRCGTNLGILLNCRGE